MSNLTKKTITRGAVVALALSAGAATTANAAVTRVSGADRYATATKVADAWPAGSTTAVLAAGEGHNVDALTIAPLAKQKNAPIILVDTAASTASIVAQFSKYTTVYIANGTGVVSSSVETALTAAGKKVIRLGGATRYATALNIAKELGTATDIVIANGDDEHLVDSLSIASIAAAKGMPIFLTSANSLDSAEATYAKGLAAKNVYALGGKTLVSDASVAGLGATVTRLAGAGRYETNAAVVTAFIKDAALDSNDIYVASGEDANLIDSLVAAPLAGLKKAPIVFAHNSLNADVNTLLNSGIIDKDTNITILGGTGAVSQAASDAIKNIQAPGSVSNGTLAVSSVAATSASTFKVTFSQAPADTKKVVFTVLQGTATVPVTATWNTANTEATVTKGSNFTAGDYTVNVKNDTTDLGTSKVTVSEQKIAKINITSTKLGVTSSSSLGTQVGYATYSILDQYGVDVTNSALANNVQFQTGVGSATWTKGLLTITPSSGLNLLTFSSGIVITANDTTSGVSTSATLTATSQLGTLTDISLTALTNVDNKVLTAGDTTDVFYAGFTATDISGNPTTNYTLMKSGLILTGDSSDKLTTSSPYVTAKLIQDPADSTKGLIEVRATSDTITLDMPVVITAMTWTGKTSQISTTLKKQAAVDTFTLQAPSDAIASNEEKEIPFTALDQNGTAITKYSDLNGIVTLTGAYFVQNIDGSASVKNTKVANTGTASVPAVLSAVTPTGKYSSVTINIQKPVKADSFTVSSTIFKTNMQQATANTDSKGNIISYQADGGVQKGDFGWDKGGFVVKDQYGRVIDMTDDSANSQYQIVATSSAISVVNAYTTDESGATSVITPNVGITSGKSYINLKAVGIGSATVTFNLIDTANKNAVVDTKSQTFTVVKNDDIKGYTIDTCAAPIYAVTTSGSIVATKLVPTMSFADDFKFNPTVYGTTSTGGKVVLAGSPVIGATVDSSDFGVYNVVTGKNAIDSVKVVANKLSDNNTTSSTNLAVTLIGADGDVHTVTTPVKSSTAAPVATTVTAGVATQVAGITKDGDIITVTKQSGSTYAALLGTTLARYDATTGLGGKRNVYLRGIDQYGTKGQALSQFVVVTSKTNLTAANPFAVDSNGTITNVENVNVNDYITVSGVASNGMVKTIKIIFK